MMTLTACLMLAAIGVFEDCNGNGVDDAIDIASGVSLDCDGNGVPDECQPCDDCDGDGVLDWCEATADGGLVGEYWISVNGVGYFSERLGARIDSNIDFQWGDDAPHPALPTNDFSVRWSGVIVPPVSGELTFFTTTDDGVRLWVDGVLLIDRWVSQSPTEWSGTIALAAGVPYEIRMDYFEAGGGAQARLEWSAAGLERQVVPTEALHPLDDLDGDGWPDGCADCNGNGIVDAQDLLDGTSFDCNGNCVPDECDIAPPGGVGYWRCEEGDVLVLDWDELGLDGVAVNGISIDDVPVNPVPANGLANSGAMLLGGNGYVLVPGSGDAASFAGSDFTIEAWVRLDELSSLGDPNLRQFLVQKKGSTSPGRETEYAFLVQGGNVQDSMDWNYGRLTGFSGRELALVFGNGAETWSITSNLRINDHEWHHVSVAFDVDDVTARFGLDGIFESVRAVSHGHFAATADVLLGAHTNASGTYNQFLRGTFDELRISGTFRPRTELLDFGGGLDCNDNGVPDECDILEGTSPDCDENGVPDECDPDCNDNGVPDGCDILEGTSLDCQGDGVPDECQLAGNDCNADGIPDDCQLAGNDCNANGVPDECDIAQGTSADCQDDGIPDDCQTTASFLYLDDGGGPEFGVRADGTQMVWLTAYEVEDGARIVDAVDVWVPFAPIGRPFTAYLWSDPNGDGDPADAQVLAAASSTVTTTTGLFRVDLPDTDLGLDGTPFFIGVRMSVTTSDFPAAMDITPPASFGRHWLIGSNDPIDPNDLSAGAIQFAPIEEALFPGRWVLRASAVQPYGDCNGNGVPDACDILDGTSDDVDGNGVPDECEDCNGNGVPDGVDIATGISLDCQGDGIPDECQAFFDDCNGDGVPDACQLDGNDCNGNGVLDACDIASGASADTDGSGVPDECEDCNGNGVLDSTDIASGFSADCQGDGIPDECQLGQPGFEIDYRHDDGSFEQTLSLGGPGSIAWLNHYAVEAGGEFVGAIDVAYGGGFERHPILAVLWSDPDGDGDPADAEVLAAVSTRIEEPGSGTFVQVRIPPVYLGEPGTSFFAGAILHDPWGFQSAVALDYGAPSGESWFAAAFDGGTIDPADLAGADTLSRFVDFGFPGDALVRAGGFDGRLPDDCNDNGVPDACDIDGGESLDLDGDGVPDECQCLGDVDGNQVVEIGDLLAVLAAWGPCTGCAADVDASGAVDIGDLLIVLAGWGACEP